MAVIPLPVPTARRAAPADDYEALEKALRGAVRGDVRFDAGTRATYSTDASNYRQVPIAVVCPADVDDAVAAVRVCHDHDVPVLSCGGGTSLAGECCNVAVVLDWTKYVHGVESVDTEARTAIILPGTVLDDANEELLRHGLVIGPKPATHSHCTIGGMIGNNSCGATAQWSGTTAANVERLPCPPGSPTRSRGSSCRRGSCGGWRRRPRPVRCASGPPNRRGAAPRSTRASRTEAGTTSRSTRPGRPARPCAGHR